MKHKLKQNRYNMLGNCSFFSKKNYVNWLHYQTLSVIHITFKIYSIENPSFLKQKVIGESCRLLVLKIRYSNP